MLLDRRFTLGLAQRQGLGNRADVLLHSHLAKDRGLLRQIANATPRATIHRQRRQILTIEKHLPEVAAIKPTTM